MDDKIWKAIDAYEEVHGINGRDYLLSLDESEMINELKPYM